MGDEGVSTPPLHLLVAKMHRALLRNGMLDAHTANYSHTECCEAVLTESLTDPEKDVVDAVM